MKSLNIIAMKSFAIAILLTLFVSMFAFATAIAPISLGEKVILPTNPTTIELPTSISKITKYCMVNLSSKKTEAVKLKLATNGRAITLASINNLPQGANFKLVLYTTSNQYVLNLKTNRYVNFSDYSDSTGLGIRIKIPANPAKGFSFPYFLVVPISNGSYSSTAISKELIIEPNNTGWVTGDRYAEIAIGNWKAPSQLSYQSYSQNQTPVLIPAFPRPADRLIYTHALDEETLFMTKAQSDKYSMGNMVGIDKQMKAMIADAKDQFAANGVILNEKVSLVGFSASGHFVHRWAMLYPEAVNMMFLQDPTPVLPVTSYKGTTLNFPLGINNFKTLFNKDFNETAFKQIKQFWFQGELDTESTIQGTDNFNDREKNIIRTVLGENSYTRFLDNQKIYNERGYTNIQFYTYKNQEHCYYSNREGDDFADFIKANLGQTNLTKINGR